MDIFIVIFLASIQNSNQTQNLPKLYLLNVTLKLYSSLKANQTISVLIRISKIRKKTYKVYSKIRVGGHKIEVLERVRCSLTQPACSKLSGLD